MLLTILVGVPRENNTNQRIIKKMSRKFFPRMFWNSNFAQRIPEKFWGEHVNPCVEFPDGVDIDCFGLIVCTEEEETFEHAKKSDNEPIGELVQHNLGIEIPADEEEEEEEGDDDEQNEIEEFPEDKVQDTELDEEEEQEEDISNIFQDGGLECDDDTSYDENCDDEDCEESYDENNDENDDDSDADGDYRQDEFE